MIVLILVALWIVVLSPAFVKKLLDRRSAVSIDTFHKQLHLLERTGPKLVSPAYRLETAQSSAGMAVGESGFPAVSSRPCRPNLVLLQPVRDGDVEPGSNELVDGSSGEHYRRVPSPVADDVPSRLLAAERVEELRRHQLQRRRRDLLLGLGSTLVITGMLGLAVPMFWVLTGLAAVALGGYVGLAAYAQLLEADRRSRLRRGHAGSPSRSWHGASPSGGAESGWWGTSGGPWAGTVGDQGGWGDSDDDMGEASRAVAR
jgi:hypothetical protein